MGETGDMAPKPCGGRPRQLSRIDLLSTVIMEWIDAEPDLTLLEIAGKLENAVGYRTLWSAVHRIFDRDYVTKGADLSL